MVTNMVNREKYMGTEDFKRSIEIIKNFINTYLNKDIQGFQDFDLDKEKTNHKKYVKSDKDINILNDPDMYPITQAIYIVLWGHIWNLSFKNLGSWGKTEDKQFPFRGDTIHACGKFGKNNKRVIKFFQIDKTNPKLFKDILKFEESYHQIGNFIVLPNNQDINCSRANWLRSMRDYFDWFLISIYNYQQREAGEENNIIRNFDNAFKSRKSFDERLKQNPEYSKDYLPISKWEEIFFLDGCFKNGVPVNYFKLDPEFRMKTTAAEKYRDDSPRYYTDEEYAKLLRIYVDKSNEFINNRTQRMIDESKKILENN